MSASCRGQSPYGCSNPAGWEWYMEGGRGGYILDTARLHVGFADDPARRSVSDSSVARSRDCKRSWLGLLAISALLTCPLVTPPSRSELASLGHQSRSIPWPCSSIATSWLSPNALRHSHRNEFFRSLPLAGNSIARRQLYESVDI